MSLILSLDQGTTSSRAIVFDQSGQEKAAAQKPFEQFFPDNGWVEHDPMEIWQSQLIAAQKAISRIKGGVEKVDAIGITNQRETTVLWDRKTGKPVYNAIVWQDRRTADYCAQLKKEGCEKLIQEKTGLVIDPYFSATKLRWILNNVKGAGRRAEKGELAFGTIDSWLVWNLTGGKLHITDATNASRTMLFNIHTKKWDDELLELFNIPRTLLPQVRNSSEVYGTTDRALFGAEIPIAAIAGDQQAALFGQGCFAPGQVKTTYGTGCFILMNTGAKPAQSKNKLLTTIAWQIGNKITYALEGSVFMGGATVQWLRDGLGIIQDSKDVEKLANSVQDNGGVYLVPAFTGLGAPHWDPTARALLIGLTRGPSQGHIARAALEAIAHQVADVLEAMNEDTDSPLTEMRVDGGASANDLLMQFQADILGAQVRRPKVLETTALGAARLAGLAIGWWENKEQIQSEDSVDKIFTPFMGTEEIKKHRASWLKAVERAKKWNDG